jgi:predicted transcriptional regulator
MTTVVRTTVAKNGGLIVPTITENIKQEENIQNTIDDQLIAWVLDVDRRMVLTESMKKHTILKASFIAQETNRSVQNISHALKEFKDQGFVMCINPEKSTWKRYTVTDNGRKLLEKLDSIRIYPN